MRLRNMGSHTIISKFTSRSHNIDPEYPLRPEKRNEVKKKLQQLYVQVPVHSDNLRINNQ
jgi:hypothetical protein